MLAQRGLQGEAAAVLRLCLPFVMMLRRPQHTAGNAGMTAPTYFERQSRQLCLLHTLNNLLQRRAFSHAELDAVAAQLPGGSCWFGNMHRTLWLGNYGVSVVELALAHHGKACYSALGS